MTKEDVKESSIREKKADKKELGGGEGGRGLSGLRLSLPPSLGLLAISKKIFVKVGRDSSSGAIHL